MTTVPDLMSTREVAEYLRIKERKVYDLVRSGRIPCTRVTGKWLFPKALIDLWVAAGTSTPGCSQATAPAPPVFAGSHDPLLDWALRECQSELAVMTGGSLQGIQRLAAGEAMVCGMHVFDSESGDYNIALVRTMLPGLDVVALEWGWRQQGLVLAPGNPLNIGSLTDLASTKARLIERQEEAGSQILLAHLLHRAGLSRDDLQPLDRPARNETDVALAVREGKADAGLAIAAVAGQLGLDFVPLHRERYDLVMRRRDYFEAPVQTLLAFARSPALTTRAEEMGGYDVSDLGRVVYNSR